MSAKLPADMRSTTYLLNNPPRRKRDGSYNMGFSVLGHECARYLQYSNRHAYQAYIDAVLEDIFQTGHEAEGKIIKRLLSIGIEVWDREERMTGFSGHWRGRMDGRCKGVVESPKVTHLLEMKSHKHTNFNKLKNHGVRKGFPKHYSQCQIYMSELPEKITLYVGYCKSTHKYYTERIEYNPEAVEELRSKQVNVLMTPYLLSRVSGNDEDFWLCRYCDAKTICYNREPIRRHCRTCEHGDQCNDAQWECGLTDTKLSFEEQMKGCDKWRVDEMFQFSMI